MPKYQLDFTPYLNWTHNDTPDWWKSNNDLKHDRSNSFKNCNLAMALNSVAALLTMLILYTAETEEDLGIYSTLNSRLFIPQGLKNLIPEKWAYLLGPWRN